MQGAYVDPTYVLYWVPSKRLTKWLWDEWILSEIGPYQWCSLLNVLISIAIQFSMWSIWHSIEYKTHVCHAQWGAFFHLLDGRANGLATPHSRLLSVSFEVREKGRNEWTTFTIKKKLCSRSPLNKSYLKRGIKFNYLDNSRKDKEQVVGLGVGFR